MRRFCTRDRYRMYTRVYSLRLTRSCSAARTRRTRAAERSQSVMTRFELVTSICSRASDRDVTFNPTDWGRSRQITRARCLDGYSPRSAYPPARRLGCPRGGRGADILGRRTYIKFNFGSPPPPPPPRRCRLNASSRFGRDTSRVSPLVARQPLNNCRARATDGTAGVIRRRNP